MRVIALPRYSENGPSSRVRLFNYLPYLEEAGFLVEFHPFFNKGYIDALYNKKVYPLQEIIQAYTNRIHQISLIKPEDTVWLQYELLPWLPAVMEKILLSQRIKLVIDFDDAVFHRYDQHDNFFVRRLLGRKIDCLMSMADMVIAGNEYLAERASQAGAKCIEIIPSVVDLFKYSVKPYKKENGRRIRVGWIGSPKTVKYIQEIEDVIKEIFHHGMEFVIIGAKKPASLANLPISELVWSLETETELINSLDIGIMPLPDTPFEKGKCGYKLIQYMACGLPVIASPVGINRDLVINGENGFLANNLSEWSQYINKLSADPNLRRNMGQRGRVLIERDYNLEKWAPKIIQILGG